MAFWNTQDRLIQDMKHKYMKNVLYFNRQMIQHRQKRKISQEQQFQQSAHQSNQEALNVLVQENSRSFMKKQHDKNVLKEYYDRQIRERENKIKMEKMQEKEYFFKEMEHRQYEESRRIMEIARMFNRKTYQARPVAGDHRRVKTETYEPQNYNNPQKIIINEPSKNLENIQVRKPQTPYYNQLPQKNGPGQQKDSLDMFNHQFKKMQRKNRY